MTKTKKSDIIEEIKVVDNWEFGNPFGEIQEIVHYSGCWKEHGRCAIKKLEELEIFLSMCKDKVDKKEMRKVLE